MKNPEIRFIDDNIDWQKKKLKNIYINSCSGGTPQATNPKYYNGNIPFLTISDINDTKFINETEKSITEIGLQHSTAKIVPKGSIAFAMYASVGKLGIINKDMATSQAFHNMTFDNNITCDFIYQRLKKKESNNEWEDIISTGTQRNLNSEKVGNTIVSIPSLKIQKEISSLLSDIDKKISNQEILIQKLKDTKSALLIKMFPQENQSVPELRFDGFTNDWEQRKLRDFVSYSSSSLTVKDVQELGIFDLYDANGIIGKVNGLPIKTEYISIIKDGAGVGRIRKLPANTLIIGTMGAFVANTADLNFIYSLLTRFNLGEEYTGSTIPHIYFKDYGDNEYYIPNIKEQTIIGDYFDKLDNLITLHQRKLDKLKEIKSALLDKLLV